MERKNFYLELWRSLKRAAFLVVKIVVIFTLFLSFLTINIVPSDSMYPAFKNGDMVLTLRTPAEYNRGDVVSFLYPFDESKIFQKRIIALSGETVEIKNGWVYIDGKKINENYVTEKSIVDYPLTKIPKNHYFLLGDNRNESIDSSVWGPISKDKLRGKTIAILYPLHRFEFTGRSQTT